MSTALRLRVTRWLEAVWYGGHKGLAFYLILFPLSALFCALAMRRRMRHSQQQVQQSVPVVVIGNISVGGTGKTPLVVRLVALLQQAGLRPAIISRGYGVDLPDGVRAVTAGDAACDVGDEPLLLAQRTGVPLVMGADRNRDIEYLLARYACDVILSDDGMQHYRMARDVEIAVIDGQRRLGNGLCLPAGALREQPQRLHECDFVLVNGVEVSGETAGVDDGEFAMQLIGDTVQRLRDEKAQPLADFAGQRVHAVTGIGNPQRFFDSLQAASVTCEPHVFPDHHAFQVDDFAFMQANSGDASLPVVMTEKDAVKCRAFAAVLGDDVWYLPVSAQLDAAFESAFVAKVQGLVKERNDG